MFLRRLFVFVLCLMTTTVFANTKQELQSAFNELNYDLTVEWDQKDKKVLSEKLEVFQNVISGLKQKGSTNEEIREVLKGMINNPKLLKSLELQASLNMLNDDKSLAEFVWKNRQDMTAQGASWNGSVQYIIGASIAVVVIAALIIVISRLEYFCIKESNYYCGQKWECTQPGDEETGCLDGYYYDWCGTDCLEGKTVWR